MNAENPPSKSGVARFRAKMVVAMMLVVGGITSGVLYFAERSSDAADQARLNNEFQGELGRQLGSQEARRGAIAERCQALARSVRILAALEEGDLPDLYLNAKVELRDVLKNDWDHTEDEFPGVLRAHAFRFLNAKGQVLPMPDQEAVAGGFAWENQLTMEGIPDDQETGYVVLTGDGARKSIHEVIVTPMISTSTGDAVGAIAVVFDPVDLRAQSSAAGIKSGILLNGHLYMPTQPADEDSFASSGVVAALDTQEGGAGKRVMVAGLPYLAFSNAMNPHSRFPVAHQVCFYPLTASMTRRAQQQRKIVEVGALVLLCGLGASYVVSTGLSKPVEKLAEDSAENLAQRERAEAALEVTERKYQSIFENAIEGIFVLSAEGTFLSINPALASICGFDSPAAMLQALHDPGMALYAEPERFREFIGIVREAGTASNFELELRRTDGSSIWVSQNARRVPNEDGAQFHFECTMEDVTQRKSAADEMLKLNTGLEKALDDLKTTQQQVIQQERLRALGEMASGVAHDFNNALTPILGYSELLIAQADDLDQATAADYLRTISTAATDAASVVRRLREFYRANAEGDAFHAIDLNKLAAQTVALTQPRWKQQAQSNGVTIEVVTDLSEGVPQIAGDAPALRETLTNLVFNAVDAMPRGGTITIRTRHQGQSSVLEVSDTGLGMTEEVRARCLEPFFSTKGERGTGLGLSMVFGIIQRHGGTLEIRSKLGEGTTFSISLPVNEGMADDAVTVLDGPQESLRRSFRVLVVDDEFSIRAFLVAVLKADGHQVAQAEQGHDALKMFHAETFDLVITDKAMPGMNGDQLAAAIKRESPRTPIILLTGFGEFLDKSSFPEIDVLSSKPISIEGLREAVSTATRRKAA